MVKAIAIGQNWEKGPIYVVKFMGKLRNLSKWQDILNLIYFLENSNLELIKFEVTGKP